MSDRPATILYVPGLMPKPPADVHHDALKRSLEAGLASIGYPLDAADAFELYAWTFDFYEEHRDFALDSDSVDRLLSRPEADERDVAEASAADVDFRRALFRIGNLLPFLIPHFATDRQRLHVRDLNRYAHNADGSATRIREGLKALIAKADNKPLLLIGHSMGSVICWDTLWELAFEDGRPADVSMFLSMGSPLGQRFVQQKLLSWRESRERGFPDGLARWVNLAAAGDMTSLDQRLGNDFACRYPKAGISIEDHMVVNAFRLDGELNTHAEYGYLANAVTARFIGDWWREALGATTPRDSAE